MTVDFFSIATATALLNGMYLQSQTCMPTPLQMFPSRKNINHAVPFAEVKVRWKESEVAIQRNFQSFLIVGCHSVLREPWWNAQDACLQWYHHDSVLHLYLKILLENSNVQWYCHHCQ